MCACVYIAEDRTIEQISNKLVMQVYGKKSPDYRFIFIMKGQPLCFIFIIKGHPDQGFIVMIKGHPGYCFIFDSQ